MRERLVGSILGDALKATRTWWDIRSLSLLNPEKAAMLANGVLAERLITNLCTGESAFLDVGAHIGSVFTSVHRNTNPSKIYAVEADPAKAQALQARFDYCEIFNCAVGEEQGHLQFYCDRDRPGYSSLVPSEGNAVEEIQVEVRLLDQIFPDQLIEVMKIDIEGAELGALRGGQELLARSRPVIMFESAGLGVNALGYSPDQLFEWFQEQSFKVFTPDRVAHDAPALGLESFLDAHEYPVRSHNFFAIPPERRLEVRNKARKILQICT